MPIIDAVPSGRTLQDGVFDFLADLENLAGNYNALIHDDGLGNPILGYGYAELSGAGGGSAGR